MHVHLMRPREDPCCLWYGPIRSLSVIGTNWITSHDSTILLEGTNRSSSQETMVHNLKPALALCIFSFSKIDLSIKEKKSETPPTSLLTFLYECQVSSEFESEVPLSHYCERYLLYILKSGFALKDYQGTTLLVLTSSLKRMSRNLT
ncbi:unnamed protein product [Ilex paraguariensis]|uniref:Uncharacterized protein n=1 Tax=Ilex paraguariensis TaxID=185542 RepID=A0ABC8RWC4_9AQUA